MRSSEGCLARQSMYSSNIAPLAISSSLIVHRLAGDGAQVVVGLVAHRDLVLLGDAEEHADDPHREHRRRAR